MGGGPDKEELLVTLPMPEPKDTIADLNKQFPHVNVTYVQVQKKGDKADELKDLFKKATILLTLFILPDHPKDCPNLRLLHLLSAGTDHLHTHPLYTSTTIPITTVSGIHGIPIAEHVLGSVLSLTRSLYTLHDQQQQHTWRTPKQLSQAPDWHGKTVGVLGYGSIGRQIARTWSGMGCRVYAYTHSKRETKEDRRDHGWVVPGSGDAEGVIPERWFSEEVEGLEGFLGSGLDLVVCCLPLTEGTRGLLGKREFGVVREGRRRRRRRRRSAEKEEVEEGKGKWDGEGAVLVNIARGKIVRQEELVEALEEGVLRGAVLDVADPEPLGEGDRLWEARNCVVTPHVSALGRGYEKRAWEVVFENLGRLERGEKLVNEVQRKRGY